MSQSQEKKARKKVLIVDDELSNIYVMEEILKLAEDYIEQVHTSFNGDDAV